MKENHAANYGSNPEPKSGKFIVFEGTDGCGKSTQAELAFQFLAYQLDCEILKTHEPTPEARKRLFNEGTLDPLQQGLTFFLDHYTHAQTVARFLEDGWVISDRYGIFSHIAYSYVKPPIPPLVDRLYYYYKSQLPQPDLVIQPYLSLEVLRERVEKRTDKPTKQSDKPWGERRDLFAKTQVGYEQAARENSNWFRIHPDPMETPEDVFQKHVKPLIEGLL